MVSNLRRMEFEPIGIVHSPYKNKKDAPHQGQNSDITSEVVIFPEYEDGLDGIERNSKLFILYYFDRAEDPILKVVPHGRKEKRGIFSTRAPPRPNPIGLTLVDLLKRDGNILTVRGLEALEGTPVLDIKPHIPDLDC
ncbi:MAG TPA: tRNA (N6-threonylcarbamoyladenosine(37)-N6)-methyltransferase TrmO [Methanobacteriaceae archaeon]|nr:tRNA (N6-threonylcarbamoyladenosine(37)-N6)-methyltransferase TrmO [Methanobacteriaceae archaeon]